jgi:hypothetical protein
VPRAIRYATPGKPSKDVDGYLERLTKYVPAEILTAYTPIALLAKDRAVLLTTLSIVFLVLTPVYLYISKEVQKGEDTLKVRPYLYVLAPASFVVWAINTSVPFRDLLAAWPPFAGIGKLDDVVASVVLVLGALAIPGIDLILDNQLKKRAK